MSVGSAIEWTQATWNPVTGCTRASAGCDNCYAKLMSHRLAAMGQKKYAGVTVRTPQGRLEFNGRVRCHESELERPLMWKAPRVVFVNSMSDLFHRDVPEAFIRRVFDVMAKADRHTFQILTKRPDRAAKITGEINVSDNVWLGTSVEDHRVIHRVRDLRKANAPVKFLSVEPLLGPIPRSPLRGLDWVIVGGESGSGARPMHADWVLAIRDKCVRQGVAFFFKQWGRLANNPDPTDYTAKKNGGAAKGGRLVEGRSWDEMPGR